VQIGLAELRILKVGGRNVGTLHDDTAQIKANGLAATHATESQIVQFVAGGIGLTNGRGLKSATVGIGSVNGREFEFGSGA